MNEIESKYFFESHEFEFTQMLESNWLTIRQELEQLLQREQSAKENKNVISINTEKFLGKNDVEPSTTLEIPQGGFVPWHEVAIYNTGWDVFGLYAFDQKMQENSELCPKTTSLVEKIPNLITAGFSSLAPGTHIRPHLGSDKYLRCHLGLIVPDDCILRVGEQTRSWKEGECFIFDDSFEHEAWNNSDKTRIVLLIDVERPN